MAQAIVTVLILLIFVAYAVFFAIWNAGITITVTGFYLAEGMQWGFQDVPLIVLPLIGVVVGAIVMAIAVGAPWSSLKSKLTATEDQLEAERARMKECARKVEALKKRVRELQPASSTAPVATTDAEYEDVGDETLSEDDV
jgi:uncharacterized membrane protein YgaE (UPF0421/DUF939 family)